MRRVSLLAIFGLFLLNCNCESKPPSSQAGTATLDLLDHLPPKDLGYLVVSPQIGQALKGLGLHVGAILDALGAKEESFGNLKKQLGFNPMVPAELDKAGIKADGGFVVWGGVPSGEEGWQPHIVFQVSNAEALIKTITALAKREAALQMEAPQEVSEGTWYGLYRTFGKKKETQGGILLRKSPAMAILTGANLSQVQAFLKVKGSVNDHPEWHRFKKRSKETADATVLITTLGAGRAMEQQAAVANLKVMPYLIKMGFEEKRLWIGSHQVMDSEALAVTQKLQPAPPEVTAPPQGVVLAAAGSLDLAETYKQIERNPLVAAQMRRFDPATRQAMVQALGQIFANLGSTYRLYLGLNGEPGSNPMMLLGQSFLGFDVIGKDPMPLKAMMPDFAKAVGLRPEQMVPTEKGYSLSTPMRVPVEMEFDSSEKRMGFRFGLSPSTQEPLPGAKKLVTLPKGTLSAFYLDLGRLGKALNGLSALQPTMKSAADQVAKILSGWSHLLVDQRLDKDYHVQTMQIVLP